MGMGGLNYMAQTTISGAASALNASGETPSLTQSPGLVNTGGLLVGTFQADGEQGLTTNSATTPTTTTNSAGAASWRSSAANYNTSHARQNPLSAYANYTYRISLYAVPEDTANLVASGSISPGRESKILSGGQLILADGGSNVSDKSQYFKKDLAIENVNFMSAIGVGTKTRGTNVLKLEFEVIEPYTSLFIPNLVLCAQTTAKSKDWRSQCYVMKIDFLGYDDAGNPTTIPGVTKYIPFTIGNIRMNLTHKGSTYHIIAIPISSHALTPMHNNIQWHAEVGGTTVNDIFNKDATDSKCVTEILNAEENAMTKGGTGESAQFKTYPDIYKFVFDPAIGNANIVDTSNFKDQSFVMTNSGTDLSVSLDISRASIKATAGTKITDLINGIIANSSYMTGQVGQTSGPVKWWKITTTVKLNEYDPITNRHAKEITFYINPYNLFGLDNKMFSNQEPTTVYKVYNYTYTGLNQDILHLDIEYKALFARTYNASGYSNAYRQVDGINSSLSGRGPFDGFPEIPGDSRIFKPMAQIIFGNATFQNTASTTRSPQSAAVNDLLSQVLDTQNDMVTLNATIVGDPDLIQQDEILYGINPPSYTSPNYSGGQIYFLFNFINPTSDYDDATGLFNTAESVPFTGLYSIFQVDSMFQKGKFTQRLTTQRVPWQPKADSTNSAGAPTVGPGATMVPFTPPTMTTSSTGSPGLTNGISSSSFGVSGLS
jgi:hypothetical protein